jgi:EAL and modified HD-GYP domain-containing signal transduction protein
MNDETSEVLVSRDPVFDPDLNVAGYELSSPQFDRAGFNLGDDAETEARLAAYKSLTNGSLEQIVGDHTAFLLMDSCLLADDVWKQIPAAKVVFRYPDGELPQNLSDSVPALLANGYSVVLPDGSSGELEGVDCPQHIVQLDVSRFAPDELESRVKKLRQSSVRILSSNLDTMDDVEFAKMLGVDFYRGRFLWKPAASNSEIPANRLALVRTLSTLQNPDISMDELEQIISQDVALSYRVLQYVNSAGTGLTTNITSVGHAVRLSGVRRLKSWASALALSAIDDKPPELMKVSLIRGHMCELIAGRLRKPEPDSYFTAGLLSSLDALLDCPMEAALKDLSLSPDVLNALLGGAGPIGEVLQCTLALERGDWEKVQAYGVSLAVSRDSIRDSYVDAIAWSDEILDEPAP